MLPQTEFDSYQPQQDDFWGASLPIINLGGIPPKDESKPVKLSFLLGFTNWRRYQIARTLESLARQEWKDFEVLICDDGSTQDMESVYQLFRPFLRMTTVRLERVGFSGCPTRAIKELVPLAIGEIFVAMQPEIMLHPQAAQWLYEAHFKTPDPEESWVYRVDKEGLLNPEDIHFEMLQKKYVCLKIGFFDALVNRDLDTVDWHSDFNLIMGLPSYQHSHEGLSNQSNSYWEAFPRMPWWFVASLRADDTIWRDMPTTKGHATIDFWLLNYRAIHGHVDICSKKVLGFHQSHIRASVAPVGEADTVSVPNLLQLEKEKGSK